MGDCVESLAEVEVDNDILYNPFLWKFTTDMDFTFWNFCQTIFSALSTDFKWE